MKVYVAGPMRGIANFNFPAFELAAIHLRKLGHEVFSPAERDVERHGNVFESETGDEGAVEGFSIREALAADTDWIAREADAIAVLPDWPRSKGAIAEVALARALGLLVAPVTAFGPDGPAIEGLIA